MIIDDKTLLTKFQKAIVDDAHNPFGQGSAQLLFNEIIRRATQNAKSGCGIALGMYQDTFETTNTVEIFNGLISGVDLENTRVLKPVKAEIPARFARNPSALALH